MRLFHYYDKDCNYLPEWKAPYQIWGRSPYLSSQGRRDSYNTVFWFMYGRRLIDVYEKEKLCLKD